MKNKDRFTWTTCKTAREYVEIALALETLAYYNKNYLTSYMCDNCNLSEEIQLLLLEAIKKFDEEKQKNKGRQNQ